MGEGGWGRGGRVDSGREEWEREGREDGGGEGRVDGGRGSPDVEWHGAGVLAVLLLEGVCVLLHT